MSQTESRHQTSHNAPALPGTGRIGVVRAYFDIYALVGAAVTAGMLVATLRPSVLGSASVVGHHPWLSILGGAIFTWGSFQTSRLLRERERLGAWAAGLTFAGSFVAAGSHAMSVPRLHQVSSGSGSSRASGGISSNAHRTKRSLSIVQHDHLDNGNAIRPWP